MHFNAKKKKKQPFNTMFQIGKKQTCSVRKTLEKSMSKSTTNG